MLDGWRRSERALVVVGGSKREVNWERAASCKIRAPLKERGVAGCMKATVQKMELGCRRLRFGECSWGFKVDGQRPEVNRAHTWLPNSATAFQLCGARLPNTVENEACISTMLWKQKWISKFEEFGWWLDWADLQHYKYLQARRDTKSQRSAILKSMN